MLVLKHLSQTLTRILRPHGFDIEICEKATTGTKDAPSGTALMLAKALQTTDQSLSLQVDKRQDKRKSHEIGIHALRGGGVL